MVYIVHLRQGECKPRIKPPKTAHDITMNKLAICIFNLTLRCHQDQILERAAGLTYRVLLAFFPFLILLISLLGTLDIDESALLQGLFYALPGHIATLAYNFIAELGESKSAGLMSTALFFSVYNTSNGFRAIIRMTNRAYGVRDRRGYITQVALSFLLMLVFAGTLIVMLGLLVFGRQLLATFFTPAGHRLLSTAVTGGGALLLLIFLTMVIFRLSCATALPMRHVLPGAVFTVAAWAAVGGGFGFVITNFTRLPIVYGSIAGVFMLVLWLNIVCVILLVGNEVNGVLREYYPNAVPAPKNPQND